jgi:hypothetical protein
MRDAHSFHRFFTGKVEHLKREIGLLPFPRKTKQRLTLSMMGICSLGLMAIKQLRQIQSNNKTLPDLRQLPRKKLIIDMEKPGNLWYCMRQVYLLSKP